MPVGNPNGRGGGGGTGGGSQGTTPGAITNYPSSFVAVNPSNQRQRYFIMGWLQITPGTGTTSFLERINQLAGEGGPATALTADNNEAVKGAVGSTEWATISTLADVPAVDRLIAQLAHTDNAETAAGTIQQSAALVIPLFV